MGHFSCLFQSFFPLSDFLADSDVLFEALTSGASPFRFSQRLMELAGSVLIGNAGDLFFLLCVHSGVREADPVLSRSPPSRKGTRRLFRQNICFGNLTFLFVSMSLCSKSDDGDVFYSDQTIFLALTLNNEADNVLCREKVDKFTESFLIDIIETDKKTPIKCMGKSKSTKSN